MGFKATEHQNAIVKMVREKRIILQIDLSALLNKKDINYSVEKLVKENKINRQKIKNRGKVGNLTDVWVLFMPDVKRLDLLEFEKQMINKEFISPLIENHCYKSAEQPLEQKIKSNVIDLQEYVKINNSDVGIMTYNKKRVVTFEDIDILHQRAKGTAKRTFSDHKNKLIEGEDYFIFKGQKGREALVQANCTRYVQLNTSPNFKSYLLTESGYLLLVKPFTDDLSWDVQRQLVNSYFKVHELKENINNNLPVTKEDINSLNPFDFFKMVATGMN